MKLLGMIFVSAGLGWLGAVVLGQQPPVETRPPFLILKGGDLAVRAADELDFTDRTKQVPTEVYEDRDYNSVIYVTEAGSVAAMPHPDNYELIMLETAESFEAIRLEKSSGAAWRIKGEKWELIEEISPDVTLPSGDYDVQVALTTSDTMAVVRMNRRTGQAWFMNSNIWLPVEEQALKE